MMCRNEFRMNSVDWCRLRIGVILFVLTTLGYAQPAQPLLFSTTGGRLHVAGGSADVVSDSYGVEIDFDAIASGAITDGSSILLEPRPGLMMTATVQRVSMDVNQVTGLAADLVGYPFGSLLLSVSNHAALGSVNLPSLQKRYTIRYRSGLQAHESAEIADSEIDERVASPAIVPPLPAPDTVVLSKTALIQADPLDEVTVDLMIVYTPAAAVWASSRGGIDSIINQALLRAQQALDNSLTYINLRLVHSAQIDYTESGDSGTDLSRLRLTSDGYMDDVHTWRDAYGADVVSLFAQVEDTGGVGYALTSEAGFPAWAFNLSRVQQVSYGYTMIHEIGHNMGAGHHYQQNFQTGPQLYDYSSGWRWESGGSWYASVMAYASGSYYDPPAPGAYENATTVGYFSNPSVSYNGLTGDATYADNARTLRETKALTAAYRDEVTPSANLNFKATALDDQVLLRWDSPLVAGFDSADVMIRFDTLTYPVATNSGALVYQGNHQSVIHTNGIVSGQTHFYTLWASHGGRWVAP